MKINNQNTPFINKDIKAANDHKERQAQINADAAKAEEAKNDVVQLSDRAKMVARAQELATQAPDVRTEKVEDLKARIAAGSYNVSGQVVAESMIRKSITEV